MSDWIVGVDLGGTKIDIGLVDAHNRIAVRRRIATQAAEGPQRVVERIGRSVRDLQAALPAGEHIAALGLCTPGPVDHETGTLVDPPNLAGLHYAPLRQMLADCLNIPISLEHDAKATALGEFYYGAGRGERDMAYIVVGTGVGGAIIRNGELLRGPHNSAGEIGHITLDPDGELCSCGSRGCVETFISGPWLARRYLRALTGGRAASCPGDQPIRGEQIASLAGQGDPLAQQVMDGAGEALGIAIASLAMILDIDLFVVGGSVAKSGDWLLEPARKALPKHAYRSVSCGVQIVATELGEDGPILGCAWLARQSLRDVRHRRSHSTRRTAAAASERAQLEAVEGIVFDVQRFSVHDGPGLRTNVFLKGCPLRCPWCANPESQSPCPELALSAPQCMDCGMFAESCSTVWPLTGLGQSVQEKYGGRAEVCPTQALRWLGERRTAGDVMAEVLRDTPFYDASGGLTLTGGEPTFQPRMAEAILRLAKMNCLSTALETSGHTRWRVLERLLPFLDHIFYDVKHLDSDIHRAYTGVDNALILSNLRKLAALKAPVTVRVPLIPGFNASVESLRAITEFVLGLDGLAKTISLLPYHTLGRAKYRALGRPYPWEAYQRLSVPAVDELARSAAACGLAVTVGS